MYYALLRIGIIIGLLSLSLSAQATLPTILIYGDSLSAGYGIPTHQSWPSLLQKKLRTRYTIVNTSLSGETTAGGLTRLTKILQQYKPTLVILALGANDGLRGLPLDRTQANLSQMIQQIQKKKAKVLLLGMQIPPNFGQEYTRHFAALYPHLSHQYKTAFMPFLLQGIINKPEYFQADQLHPTVEAQTVLMDTVYRYLLPIL